jgi:hypothetical protein
MSKEDNKPSQVKLKLNKVTKAVKSVPNIWSNLEHLVEAICLVAVAGFAFWSSYQLDFAVDFSAYALRFASVVIAIRGAVEFLKQMNKR